MYLSIGYPKTFALLIYLFFIFQTITINRVSDVNAIHLTLQFILLIFDCIQYPIPILNLTDLVFRTLVILLFFFCFFFSLSHCFGWCTVQSYSPWPDWIFLGLVTYLRYDGFRRQQELAARHSLRNPHYSPSYGWQGKLFPNLYRPFGYNNKTVFIDLFVFGSYSLEFDHHHLCSTFVDRFLLFFFFFFFFHYFFFCCCCEKDRRDNSIRNSGKVVYVRRGCLTALWIVNNVRLDPRPRFILCCAYHWIYKLVKKTKEVRQHLLCWRIRTVTTWQKRHSSHLHRRYRNAFHDVRVSTCVRTSLPMSTVLHVERMLELFKRDFLLNGYGAIRAGHPADVVFLFLVISTTKRKEKANVFTNLSSKMAIVPSISRYHWQRLLDLWISRVGRTLKKAKRLIVWNHKWR